MNEEHYSNKSVESFSFEEALLLVKKFWLQIVCITLACLIAFIIAASVLAKPKYSAEATIMINYATDVNETIGNQRNALLYGIELSYTVQDFISKNIVKKQVESNKSSEFVETNYKNGLKVTVNDNSLIVLIRYTTASGGKQAIETVNTVVKSLLDVLDSVDSNGGPVYVSLYKNLVPVDYAEKFSVSKSWPRFIAYGLISGVLASCAYIILKHLLDDTIKSRAELEKTTGFRVIAFIDDVNA